MKARHLLISATLVSILSLLGSAPSLADGERDPAPPVAVLERGEQASDRQSAEVRSNLASQGLVLDRLVDLGIAGGNRFWVGKASKDRVCLIVHHTGRAEDWVSGASCIPAKFMNERALPILLWTQQTQVRAALLPDGASAGSVHASSGLEAARFEFGNLVIADDGSWTSEISTSVELKDGRTIAIDLSAGPSALD